MKFDIITIFPKLFDSFLFESLIAKAQKKGLINIRVHDLRRWTTDKHHKVDDHPYGGGPGMILKVEPIYRALRALKVLGIRGQGLENREKFKPYYLKPNTSVVMLDPAGKQFDQRMAEKFSKLKRIVLLCGRYEGFDHRVTKFVDERVSVGPYVLNGGEVPAMVLIEAAARLVPGFVGKPESLREETFSRNYEITKLRNYESLQFQSKFGISKLANSQFIEYPQYTRPEVFKIRNQKSEIRNLRVPKVLLSGDHKKIQEWREKH